MSGFYSGKEGELFIDGTKVAKVRSWSFSMNQAVLETVSLEDADNAADLLAAFCRGLEGDIDWSPK